MTIREATPEELPMLDTCARAFYESSKHLKEFDLGRFTSLWGGWIRSGIGAVFILIDSGAIVGAIAGIVHPDAYSAAIVAQEFFWFVLPDFRGGGVRLYRVFEAWARDKGCNIVRMAYLTDSMPGKVKDFYERLGFSAVEVAYSKELS